MANPIKEAFSKAKDDILSLQSQIDALEKEIISIKRTINDVLTRQSIRRKSFTGEIQTDETIKQTLNKEISAVQQIPVNKTPQYRLKDPNNPTSIGNDGVPADRQTDQQTDQHIGNKGVKQAKEDEISRLESVSNILSSLDGIKKELRSKFKHLTSQEMAVFSMIYELENQGFIVDYPLISQKLKLSESSIRDYIQKIVKKGIPIQKLKENNKKVILGIDKNLRNLTTLEAIQALRNL